MYKRIINIILLLISLMFIILFDFDVFGLVILIPFVYSIIFILFLKRKNKNSAYNVLLSLLSVLSVGYIIFEIVYDITSNISMNQILFSEYRLLSIILFSIYSLLIMHILDYKKKINNNNFILTIIISLVVMFIFIRYNIDPHFEIRNLNNYSGNDLMKTSERYIYQNYPYMVVMYISLLINYLMNNQYKR